ncbi:CcdB family protein [Variovorax sp. NFACC27]|uniref:CcdB family protein n=1 Tax=unclassified Variovorax TaxID=663243 RepID=UPI00089A41C9|nr:toxin CcdB [Variovorax paradoxus]SEF35181.1 toxin CcdB [Variovorax sp. NFACC28]SEG98746.1 toxin CcdB [Variovorax sp. NFACC29]SFE14794.1 toxin CcdB [Variovorax sp. NFACC26]SFH19431.1 toxin CcdB [Variovorax sp. NFACC27]
MAQFDVYANPSKTQRGEIPWMVDIQSEILDKLPTCLVMPLALRANMPAAMPRSLCPTIGWNGAMLVALPHLAAPFRVKDLDSVQGNLRSQASDFAAALDAVISGI